MTERFYLWRQIRDLEKDTAFVQSEHSRAMAAVRAARKEYANYKTKASKTRCTLGRCRRQMADLRRRLEMEKAKCAKRPSGKGAK